MLSFFRLALLDIQCAARSNTLTNLHPLPITATSRLVAGSLDQRIVVAWREAICPYWFYVRTIQLISLPSFLSKNNELLQFNSYYIHISLLTASVESTSITTPGSIFLTLNHSLGERDFVMSLLVLRLITFIICVPPLHPFTLAACSVSMHYDFKSFSEISLFEGKQPNFSSFLESF